MARTLHELAKDFVVKNANDLCALLKEVDELGFQRGFSTASAKMQAAFEAALGAAPPSASAPTKPVPVPADEIKRRAARGSVPKYLNAVMAQMDYQPLDYAGIGKCIEAMGGKGIALASVRNRLREMEINRDAERDALGRWKLTEKGRAELRQVTLASHTMFKHKEAAE